MGPSGDSFDEMGFGRFDDHQNSLQYRLVRLAWLREELDVLRSEKKEPEPFDDDGLPEYKEYKDSADGPQARRKVADQ